MTRPALLEQCNDFKKVVLDNGISMIIYYSVCGYERIVNAEVLDYITRSFEFLYSNLSSNYMCSINKISDYSFYVMIPYENTYILEKLLSTLSLLEYDMLKASEPVFLQGYFTIGDVIYDRGPAFSPEINGNYIKSKIKNCQGILIDGKVKKMLIDNNLDYAIYEDEYGVKLDYISSMFMSIEMSKGMKKIFENIAMDDFTVLSKRFNADLSKYDYINIENFKKYYNKAILKLVRYWFEIYNDEIIKN